MNDIVYEGKINNNSDILIRYPRNGDGKAMSDYKNTKWYFKILLVSNF